MPIHAPGKRDRKNRIAGRSRNLVALLSLTAMVDMFTVLVVFLLQNYNTTGQVLYIPKEVQLPKASSTKELKPAHVITVSEKEVLLDSVSVATFTEVKEQKDWMIRSLYNKVVDALRQDDVDYQNGLRNSLKNVVQGAKTGGSAIPDESRRKVTVQADKAIDFLSIKKVMYTATEAGVVEINFAVIQKEKPKLE
jgi:biopolymer transport protein ExbD